MSDSAEQALAHARDEARRLGHDSIGAEHILLALLRPGAPGEPIIRRLGLEPDQVRARLEAGGRRGRPRRSGEELAYTSHARRLIEAASKGAREAGVELSAEHLFLAALQEPRGAMGRILGDSGITASRVSAEAAAPAPAAKRSPARPPAPPPATTGLPPHLQKSSTPGWRLILLGAVPVSIVLWGRT